MSQETMILKYVFKKIPEKVRHMQLNGIKSQEALKGCVNYYTNILSCFNNFVNKTGFDKLTESIESFKSHTDLS